DTDGSAGGSLSDKPATARPAGAVAGDRRASAAGPGELAPDGRLYRPDRVLEERIGPARRRNRLYQHETLLARSDPDPAGLSRRPHRGADPSGDQHRRGGAGANPGGRDG